MYVTKIIDIEDHTPDITNLDNNTTLHATINEVKNQIPSITNLTTTASLNAKINKVKNKIPNITNLASTTALTAVENKIPDHSKYITISEINKLTARNFTARLKQANLTTKVDIVDFVKETDFDDKPKNLDKKVTSSKSKHVPVENELKKIQDKIEKSQTYDSSLFIGQSYFFNDGAQLFLIFQTLCYILKRLGNTEKVVSWKSKGLSAKKLTTPTLTDNSLSPSFKCTQIQILV